MEQTLLRCVAQAQHKQLYHGNEPNIFWVGIMQLLKHARTFLSSSLLFFTSSLLPCPLPPPLPPPPPPPPSPPPPPPAPAPGMAPLAWAPWPAGSLGRASWFSLSGLDSFLPMPGTTPSWSRQSMMLRATSQILELMSWLRTAYSARRTACRTKVRGL